MKSRIGVVQMNSSNQPADNVAFAKAQTVRAADQSLDLVSFSETFIYMIKIIVKNIGRLRL